MATPPSIPRAVRFGAAIVVIVALLLCRWQVSRHAERNVGRDVALTLVGTPPLESNATLHPGAAWHRVDWQGRFDGSAELVAGRMLHDELGYGLVQRFVREDGVAVVVDRGWAPAATIEDTLATLTRETDAELTGQLRPAEGRVGVSPVIGHGTRIWPARSWATIVKEVGGALEVGANAEGTDEVHGGEPGGATELYVVEGGPQGEDRGKTPIENGFVGVPDRDDTSLHYASQWFAIAAIAGIVLVPAAMARARQILGA